MIERQRVSRILAIRLARLGDVTLLLPSLGVLKSAFPDASVTLLTGVQYEPLARLCPSVDDVIAIDRLRMRDGSRRRALQDVLALVRELRSGRFDLVIDFHGFRETNLMAWASGGRQRIGMKRSSGAYLPFCFNLEPVVQEEGLHAARMFQRVVQGIPGLEKRDPVPGPSLRIPDTPMREDSPTVSFYVGASVRSRRWPADRFAALAVHVLENWGGTVLVLAGLTPEEEAVAAAVAAGVEHTGRVRLLRGLSIPEMARMIAASDLLVSNDSGPMHVGSALGVPTLGIFSQSPPRHYRPVGPQDRFIHSSRVEDVELEAVVGTIEEMRVIGLRPESRGSGFQVVDPNLE